MSPVTSSDLSVIFILSISSGKLSAIAIILANKTSPDSRDKNSRDYMKNYIGNKIKELRKQAGLTQSELAARLGVSSSSVGMYEQGRREPDNDMILKLCNIFGVTSDSLIGNKKAESRELSDVFNEFTQLLSSQQGLMFDGVPLNDEDINKLVDAINVVAAIAKQQHKKKSFG